MRYQTEQSKVNPDSYYVDDTEQNKTIAVFLKPYGKIYAEEYADWLNTRGKTEAWPETASQDNKE